MQKSLIFDRDKGKKPNGIAAASIHQKSLSINKIGVFNEYSASPNRFQIFLFNSKATFLILRFTAFL